eukprot:1215870-Rhodomonas_salina.3
MEAGREGAGMKGLGERVEDCAPKCNPAAADWAQARAAATRFTSSSSSRLLFSRPFWPFLFSVPPEQWSGGERKRGRSGMEIT